MIRFGNSIRLTRPEAERLARLTGFIPLGVKTLSDLDRYVTYCKAQCERESQSPEALRWLLDEEISRCLSVA